MRFTVKKWFYEDIQSKSEKYNWRLCYKMVYRDIAHDVLVFSEEYGKNLFDGGKADVAGFSLFGEKIGETKKAIKVKLSFWNFNRWRRYITDTPVETRFITWIPKSVIIA